MVGCSAHGTTGYSFTGGLDLDAELLAHMEKSDGRTIRKSPAHSPLISFFPSISKLQVFVK